MRFYVSNFSSHRYSQPAPTDHLSTQFLQERAGRENGQDDGAITGSTTPQTARYLLTYIIRLDGAGWRHVRARNPWRATNSKSSAVAAACGSVGTDAVKPSQNKTRANYVPGEGGTRRT